MTLPMILCWISLAVLIYCYIGYGLLIACVNLFRLHKQVQLSSTTDLPHVTLIVTAFNEAAILPKKIQNTLSINYPADRLELVFVTDGSTDGSELLLRNEKRIRTYHLPERKGKYAAIKRAMKEVGTPLVVFTDANTMLNSDCLLHIIPHYLDPEVGGVAGEKKIGHFQKGSAVGEVEGFYWQYESTLKRWDARFYTVTGAAGELFSIRTSLFRDIDEDIILDDFFISMQVCLAGYRIDYEPRAFAVEAPSATLADEEKRKVRISAGAYQSIHLLKEGLHFRKQPLLAFQFFSRRILRWILCPVLLLTLFFCSLLAHQSATTVFYNGLLYAQFFFYGVALIGWFLVRSGRKAGLLGIPFYFVFMNYCLVKGLIVFLRGKQTVLWEKSLRQAME